MTPDDPIIDDADAFDLEDTELEFDEDREQAECEPECEFLTGAAGTGKTFEVKRRIEEDPSYGILCATTGIAAVNLNAVTLHSTLKYFDTASLEDMYYSYRLTKVLADLAKVYRKLVIDEISMLSAEQLDIIYRAMTDVNGYAQIKRPMGIVLTGDFCQLPPIKSPWAFTAECWPKFEANTVRLTRFWRHPDQEFLRAINLVREGNGPAGAKLLSQQVEFADRVDSHYDGTTIFGKNLEVDRFNFVAHRRVDGRLIAVKSDRWGKERKEWGLIPERLLLKVGAYVMILSNSDVGKSETAARKFEYVNGDCGHVRDFDEENDVFVVELVRTGEEVYIPAIKRFYTTRNAPSDEEMKRLAPTPYKDNKIKRWIWGGITYYPLRLAYAATVHKTQGLSLDRVQIDCRGAFFGRPGMAYVALSRCRTPEGVRIVGTPELFGRRVSVAKEVLKWL